MVVNTIALPEAKTSTSIENIFATGDELYKASSDITTETKAKLATKEVLKYSDNWTRIIVCAVFAIKLDRGQYLFILL